MDIELARTYLAVMQHGSFKHAATSLHCTQSTVTARIQHLEQLLGRPLFTRSRAGATATAEGRRFRPYAERLMFSWREAQQALGLPSHLLGSLRVALDRRLAHTLGPALSQRLLDGLPDWSVELLESPQPDTDIQIGIGLTPAPGRQPLAQAQDTLVLVASSARTTVDWDPDFRAIDWGPQFRADYARHYQFDEVPQLHLPATPWSLTALKAVRGSAYFPLSWCQADLAQGRLFQVTGAASFSLAIAAVCADTDAVWATVAAEAIGATFDAVLP